MNQKDRPDAARKAQEDGYKKSAYEANKWIKDSKVVKINENNIKVDGSHYNNGHDAKNSKSW